MHRHRHRRTGKGRIEHQVDILTAKFVGDSLKGGAFDKPAKELVEYCDTLARLVLDVYIEEEDEEEVEKA